VASRLIELANLRPGMMVADFGCGTGAVAIPAARIVNPGRVTGIDSSAAMIVQARQKAMEAGVKNVMLLCEDAMAPVLERGTQDAVLASMLVTYLPQPAMALHAWRDLLRREGVLAFSWVLDEDPEWQPAYDAVDQFLRPEDRWSAARHHWSIPEAETALPPDMTTTATTVEPLTTWYRNLEHWWESAWIQAPSIAWSKIPEMFRDAARDAAFVRLRGLQNRDGSLERTRPICYTAARQ
jgi:ubiquinone/menaquinone biosynthesis C-methylase UbiE